MKETKNTKDTKADSAQTINELLAELAQAKAQLAQESAAKAALENALENAKKAKASKKTARPAHVEFLRNAPARAVLAIAATGKAATSLVPAYLAVTLLSGSSHATGAARQVACTVSRGLSYTAGVMPELLPAEITARFDALKEDIKTVAGWIELRGLGDDYNIIDKETLQAITDAPDCAHHLYVKFLNDLRLQALEVQKKAFPAEQFAKIEENTREVCPWNFEDWEVSPAE